MDTAFNDSDAADFRADPKEFQDMMTKNYAFGAFVSNEAGYITTLDKTGKSVNRPNDSYKDFMLSYNATSKDISVNYDGKVWSYNVSGKFSNNHLSLIISAGTGLASNKQSVIVHSLDAVLDSAPVTVKYIDENQASIAPDKILIDTLNAPYDVTGNQYKIPITGYVLDDNKLPSNAVGTFSNSEQIVTYIYKVDQLTLNVKNSTIYTGDVWSPQDNFVSATDVDGNKVDFNQLTVDASKVDTNKAGIYDVTYTYDGVTSTARVTVKDKTSNVLLSEENKDIEAVSEKISEKNDNKNDKSDDSVSKKILPETGEAQLLVTTTMIPGFVILLMSILLARKQLKK